MYQIVEVGGTHLADTICRFNALEPSWPALTEQHLSDGYWWLAYPDDAFYSFSPQPIAFAGMVPMEPFPNIGYCKRCWVSPDHLGHGIQFRMLILRIVKAKNLGWTHLVTECSASNGFSANNLRKANFDLCDPEQRWGNPGDLYWVKKL